MKEFIIIGHKAVTQPFSLNDLCGSAGRMDILCRCVNSALFISHGLRRDVRVYLVLKGGEKTKILRFEGKKLKYLNPDERSIASIINKSLTKNIFDIWTDSTPGVSIRYGDFESLIKEINKKIFYLREDGKDIKDVFIKDPLFIIGDHTGLNDEEEKVIQKYEHEIVSVSPISLHADHCIVILHNIIDKHEL